RRYNDKWEDLSIAAIQRDYEHGRETQKKLAAIDRSKLSSADQLHYDLFKREVDEGIEEFQFKYWLLPVNQRGGIQTIDTLTEVLPFETAKDYADWLPRMRSVPTSMAP